MIKLQENKFKFLEKNFKEIIIKDFHWEANGHNDNYMINMGSQSPKISDNWPLFGPYLQRCFSTDYVYSGNHVCFLSNLFSQLVFLIYILGIIKWHETDLFCQEKQYIIWYPSVEE